MKKLIDTILAYFGYVPIQKWQDINILMQEVEILSSTNEKLGVMLSNSLEASYKLIHTKLDTISLKELARITEQQLEEASKTIAKGKDHE